MKNKLLKNKNLLLPYQCKAVRVNNKDFFFVEFRTKTEKLTFQIHEN